MKFERNDVFYFLSIIFQETSEVEHQNAIRSKEELQVNLKGLQVDLSKHSREIAEYEAKLRTSDQQINQLKGDVNGKTKILVSVFCLCLNKMGNNMWNFAISVLVAW